MLLLPWFILLLLFLLGGYAYSLKPNPWRWLTSREAAEAMAERVARWPEKYNCDGIDLDIEEGAGDQPEAGANMVHFIRRLRELQPRMIVGQPTYGIPKVTDNRSKGNSNRAPFTTTTTEATTAAAQKLQLELRQ